MTNTAGLAACALCALASDYIGLPWFVTLSLIVVLYFWIGHTFTKGT